MNKNKLRVLVACEYSGKVRDAFAALGHQAMSCDLLPTDRKGLHYEGNVMHVLDGWMPVQYTSDCLDDLDCDTVCRTTGMQVEDCYCVGPTQDEIEYEEINGQLFGRPVDHPHWDIMIAHPPCTHLATSGARWFKDKVKEQKLAIEFVRELLNCNIEHISLENPVGVLSTKVRLPDQIINPWEYGHGEKKRTCLWLKNLPLLQPTNIVEGRSNRMHMMPDTKDRWKKRSETYQGIADAMALQYSSYVLGLREFPKISAES